MKYKIAPVETDDNDKDVAKKIALNGEFTSTELAGIWRQLKPERRYVVSEDAGTQEILVGDAERCLFFLRGPKAELASIHDLVDSANISQDE